jgi:surface protein
MKKLLLLIISLVSINQTIAQAVVLDNNGVTIKWTGTTVPSPYFIEASPRGTLEWFAIVDDNTRTKIKDYAKNIQSGIDYFTPTGESTPIPFDNIVTTLITDMGGMFDGAVSFNQDISSWDVSNVTSMSYMFLSATAFNQNIDSWNVSNVINMHKMFWKATTFNQPIGSWNVSNVTDMGDMIRDATAFNQPIGSWDVSKVTLIGGMFVEATSFNQPIDSWDVSNVTDMYGMFGNAASFNQPLNSWDVSNVTEMNAMFYGASAFNQPIGSWNVSNVTNMGRMFYDATSFNQPIETWNVSNVQYMNQMFYNATAFNQSIGSWDVSNVTNMANMFTGATLSTANYDATLIGWSSKALKSNVIFSGGNSTYCNSANARGSIINTYNWTITDGGLDCATAGVEEENLLAITIYPNPTSNTLFIKGNETPIKVAIYNVLGKEVLSVKNANNINVQALPSGVYIIRISDGIQQTVQKFIKN